MTPRLRAVAAAPPLVLPPGFREVFQGFRVTPVIGLSPTPFQPYSGMVVLPTKRAPASRSRATAGASSGAGSRELTAEPRKQVIPAKLMLSLTETGTPSSAPQGSPLVQRASLALAAASSPSSSVAQNALMAGSKASRRAITSRATSTGDRSRVRYRETSSSAPNF